MKRGAAELAVAPLCLDPFSAILAKREGFRAVYLGGGGLGYSLGVSEALLTAQDFIDAADRICSRVDIPVVVDGGVGFGDAIHTAHTVKMIERTGACAIELEDQIAPKRAHHHKDIEHLVSTEEMVGKLKAAVDARTDWNFLIIARSDAMQLEGIDRTVERAHAYAAAGVDMIMVRARTEAEFQAISKSTSLPLASLNSWVTKPEPEMLAAGFSLLLDANSLTILTYLSLTKAYRLLKTDPFYGYTREEVMGARAEVQTIIGLEELYAMEAETTEKQTLAELKAAGRKNNHLAHQAADPAPD